MGYEIFPLSCHERRYRARRDHNQRTNSAIATVANSQCTNILSRDFNNEKYRIETEPEPYANEARIKLKRKSENPRGRHTSHGWFA